MTPRVEQWMLMAANAIYDTANYRNRSGDEVTRFAELIASEYAKRESGSAGTADAKVSRVIEAATNLRDMYGALRILSVSSATKQTLEGILKERINIVEANSHAAATTAWMRLKEALDSLPVRESAPSEEWVSVEERLPEFGQWALFSMDDGSTQQVMRIKEPVSESDWLDENVTPSYVKEFCTHWRPLPPAPEKAR